MKKKTNGQQNKERLVSALKEIDFPIYDKKHNFYITLEGKVRKNEIRIDHIVKHHRDLAVKDIQQIKEGINNYFKFTKDPVYKGTYNYYIIRGGKRKGFVKISIQVDHKKKNRAWIKTIFTTYHIK